MTNSEPKTWNWFLYFESNLWNWSSLWAKMADLYSVNQNHYSDLDLCERILWIWNCASQNNNSDPYCGQKLWTKMMAVILTSVSQNLKLTLPVWAKIVELILSVWARIVVLILTLWARVVELILIVGQTDGWADFD